MTMSGGSTRLEHMFDGDLSDQDPGVLTLLTRQRAVAEAAEWSALLRYSDARRATLTESATDPMNAHVARSSVAVEIAQATGLSEAQVVARVAIADRIRSRTPRTWTAFQTGLLDAARVREISAAVERLAHPESVTRLDREVLGAASAGTVAELRRWLGRFIRRVEPDQSTRRAADERARRHVRIDHDDDGMSHLYAYLPSIAAGAIERRLHHDARSLPADDRTLAQKRADLLTSWGTCNTDGTPAPHTDIAVVVDADVLAGARTGFAESADGAWAVPAAWMQPLLDNENTFWWRILRDPVTRDVLSIDHLGRFAPDQLRRALLFRDGVCAHPGCLVPAWACDIDHVRPWPTGPTRGDNLVPRSRRHHAHKGHGIAPPRRRTAAEALLIDLAVEYAVAR